MIQRILVLGGGSAGFLAAISLKIKLPDLQVSVVRSKEMGVIGVGEATTFAFPNYLHGRLKIDPGEFHRNAQPTWKLGIRFLNWGPRRHFDYTFRPQVTSRWENLSKVNGYYCYEDFEYADVFPALMSHDKAFLRNQHGGPHIGTDVALHIENRTFVENKRCQEPFSRGHSSAPVTCHGRPHYRSRVARGHTRFREIAGAR